jgi:hypothetical protein
MHDPTSAGTKTSRFAKRLIAFGKWIVAHEDLQVDTYEPLARQGGSIFFAWLMSSDSLPKLTDPTPHRQGFFPWLVSRDQLPIRSGSLKARLRFLAWLTAREVLPVAPHERGPAARSFFGWLLSSEPEDRFESLHSTKEVPPHET